MSKRILSMMGGGIFGLLQALILEEIEVKAGKPIADLFDLLAGTSTGGIIACGLAARVPAATLVSLYQDHGGEIFNSSLLRDIGTVDGLTGPKYSADALEALLKETLQGATLKGIVPHLLVPATRCNRSPSAFWFRSWGEDDFDLWQVARATSAAPYYFPVAEITSTTGDLHICTDGGLFANNPEDYALGCAQDLWPNEDLSVLSIGTGSMPLAVAAKPDWGGIDWLPQLIELILQSQEDVTAERMSLSGAPRTLFNPPIGGDMDDVSPANIAAIKSAAASVTASVEFANYVSSL